MLMSIASAPRRQKKAQRKGCARGRGRRSLGSFLCKAVSGGGLGANKGLSHAALSIWHNDSYSETKAEGEALVIKANGINGLLTCCIRPSSIFGPGDKLLVPSLVAAARAGKSKFIIGDGTNMYDFTYVENVAHAHVCAERALASDGSASKRAAGEAYFITNMEPIKFWEFMSLESSGLLQEGLKRTIESYSNLRAELLPRKEGPSKAVTYLGNGIVADIFLWRNTRLTWTAILGLFLFYINYVLPGSTMITAISKVLMWASIALFVHGKLPDHLFVQPLTGCPSPLSSDLPQLSPAPSTTFQANSRQKLLLVGKCSGRQILPIKYQQTNPRVHLQTLISCPKKGLQTCGTEIRSQLQNVIVAAAQGWDHNRGGGGGSTQTLIYF
ncbi:hypothetical protein R6Q57_013521 [Mikania cordata]